VEFYAPVMLVVAMGAYLLYYGGWWLALGWQGMWILPLLAIAGYLSVLYKDFFQVWNHRRKWALLPEDIRRSMAELRTDCQVNVSR